MNVEHHFGATMTQNQPAAKPKEQMEQQSIAIVIWNNNSNLKICKWHFCIYSTDQIICQREAESYD